MLKGIGEDKLPEGFWDSEQVWVPQQEEKIQARSVSQHPQKKALTKKAIRERLRRIKKKQEVDALKKEIIVTEYNIRELNAEIINLAHKNEQLSLSLPKLREGEPTSFITPNKIHPSEPLQPPTELLPIQQKHIPLLSKEEKRIRKNEQNRQWRQQRKKELITMRDKIILLQNEYKRLVSIREFMVNQNAALADQLEKQLAVEKVPVRTTPPTAVTIISTDIRQLADQPPPLTWKHKLSQEKSTTEKTKIEVGKYYEFRWR